ncbi:hypothetical protein G7Y89_g5294 [Cudoniella acicularis]|uniref:DUF7053 domain-containing protein n=1 Tax=Cudoniella acicularis TaxID=354080 RepID=A0A8H4W3X3_9HELO|nr:hypothetical protein G7Y89_g5294 [Cudoniella acicularis]
MSSIINTTTIVTTQTTLAAHITKADVIAYLHDKQQMMLLNPLVKSHTALPPSNSVAFYKSVPTNLKPSSTAEIEALIVYSVVEAQAPEEASGETWRGGWAKRFIPEEITYEVSQQNTEHGMFSITHAPMGVHSVTTWTVREEGGRLVLDKKGEVTSNRMLMGFIKTTLQESYDKLARDFVEALEKSVKGKGQEVEEKKADKAEGVTEEIAVETMPPDDSCTHTNGS